MKWKMKWKQKNLMAILRINKMYINNKKILKKVAQIYFKEYMESRNEQIANEFEKIKKILNKNIKQIME